MVLQALWYQLRQRFPFPKLWSKDWSHPLSIIFYFLLVDEKCPTDAPDIALALLTLKPSFEQFHASSDALKTDAGIESESHE